MAFSEVTLYQQYEWAVARYRALERENQQLKLQLAEARKQAFEDAITFLEKSGWYATAQALRRGRDKQ